MQFLWEKGIGFDSGFGNVPIVCGASLFDLELVSNQVRPDKAMGYAACQNAWSGAEPAEGNVGAGTGATVGKFHGPAGMMKTGLGIYAAQVGAVQCGYCTPGMLLSGIALLDLYPHPTREQIRKEMEGNICRCTGYARIADAIQLAAERINGKA